MGTNVANGGMSDWWTNDTALVHEAGYSIQEHAPATGSTPHADDYHAHLSLTEGRWDAVKGDQQMTYSAWYAKHTAEEKTWLDDLPTQAGRALCHKTAQEGLAWPL